MSHIGKHFKSDASAEAFRRLGDEAPQLEGRSSGVRGTGGEAALPASPTDGQAAKRGSHHEPAAIAWPKVVNPAEVDRHLVSVLSPTSYEAEHYRTLRYMLEQMARAGGCGTRIIAVTSANVDEGKTTTAINLAGALAQASEARVLLVDADLRRSCVGARIGMGDRNGPGLAEAIQDVGMSLDAVIRRCPRFNLSVLPAGGPPAAPYEVLKSPRLGGLLETARQQYDSIVVDAPPVLPVSDSRLIGRWVDGFLVVVAAHRTPRLLLEEALSAMDPTKVFGLVFNQDEGPLSRYYSVYASSYGQSSNGNRATWRRKKAIAFLRPQSSAGRAGA